MDVVGVIGGHKWQAGLLAQDQEGFVEPVKVRQVVVALKLKVEVGHRTLVPEGDLFGFIVAPIQNETRHLSLETPG